MIFVHGWKQVGCSSDAEWRTRGIVWDVGPACSVAALHRYIEAWQAPWMETINFKRILFKPFRDEEIVPALHKDERGERGPLACRGPRTTTTSLMNPLSVAYICIVYYRDACRATVSYASLDSSSFPSTEFGPRLSIFIFIFYQIMFRWCTCRLKQSVSRFQVDESNIGIRHKWMNSELIFSLERIKIVKNFLIVE